MFSPMWSLLHDRGGLRWGEALLEANVCRLGSVGRWVLTKPTVLAGRKEGAQPLVRVRCGCEWWPLVRHCARVNPLGHAIGRWTPRFTNWHVSAVPNGPTEALNNLITRTKQDDSGSGPPPTTESAPSSTPESQLAATSPPVLHPFPMNPFTHMSEGR